MRGKYLSEVIKTDNLEFGKLNLIEADCGAGKTTFAIDVLAKQFGAGKTAYLIDTKRGKDQLLLKDECIDLYTPQEILKHAPEDIRDDLEAWIDSKITVMTYAQFAYWCRNNESFRLQFDCIICDEIHNLVNFMEWDRRKMTVDSLNFKAMIEIVMCIHEKSAMVVALSATPDKVYHLLRGYNYVPKWDKTYIPSLVNLIVPEEEVRHYETNHTRYFNNLYVLYTKIPKGKKGIVYVPRISQMKDGVEFLRNRGINAAAIWSENNMKKPMTGEQMEVNYSIVHRTVIPDDIQVLFINKSSETSINITTPVDFIIIKDSDKDTIKQVRGRYRGDLQNLFLYKASIADSVIINEKWLNRRLTKADKDELCNELAIKVDGKMLRWTSVKKILKESGYDVKDKKSNSLRYTIIRKKSEKKEGQKQQVI